MLRLITWFEKFKVKLNMGHDLPPDFQTHVDILICYSEATKREYQCCAGMHALPDMPGGRRAGHGLPAARRAVN